jgi:hypothetical protein
MGIPAIGVSGSTSAQFTCNAGKIGVSTFNALFSCSGSPQNSIELGISGCQTTGSDSFALNGCGQPGGPCFHKDTFITYKGTAALKMADLEHHPECRIPHKVIADGVKIDTDSGHSLRLTNDHLVFTASRGLVPAIELQMGEKLFTTVSDDSTSSVIRITPEKGELYFGLNCLHSEVLANGIKTSTFGSYHVIPSWWMSGVGRIIGPKRASSIGDAIVGMLAKLNLM